MKQFTLTLNFNNEATYSDLREALRSICSYTKKYRGTHEELEDGDDANVKDCEGAHLGEWQIENPEDSTLSSTSVTSETPKPLGLQMADDIASALLGNRSTSITLSPAEVLAVDLMGKQARAARGVTGFDDKHQAWVLNGVYVRCGHDPMMIACTCYGRLHEGEPVAADADMGG